MSAHFSSTAPAGAEMSSESSAESLTVGSMSVALLAGLTETTVGGVSSCR
jgi:hypothetical protein